MRRLKSFLSGRKRGLEEPGAGTSKGSKPSAADEARVRSITQPQSTATQAPDPASASINVNRIGITVVHQPAKAVELDIVLVHGLFGNPKRTWTAKRFDPLKRYPGADASDSDNEEQVPRVRHSGVPADSMNRAEVFWPRDLLPKVMPTARIMTWGYDVGIDSLLRGTSTASVFRHAGMLLSDLEMARQDHGAAKRPIIFIAHSLGGIVVKDAICISQSSPLVGQTILPATKGVLFLGTPHKGSQMATVAKTAFGLSKFVLNGPNTKILRALEQQSDVLERISWGFGQILASGRLRVHSFREELDVGGMSIVSAESAIIGYFHETHGHLHASHRGMAKFHSLEDTNFRRVQAVLGRWLAEIRAERENLDHDGREARTIKADVSRSNTNFPKGLVFDEAYRMCLTSLNTAQARQRFDDVEEPFAGTYMWTFDEAHDLASWLQGNIRHPIFWVQGKPGSGKSTLRKYLAKSSLTMSHLQSYRCDDWKIITFFFHDRGSSAQKSVDGMAREILYQLLAQEKSIFEAIFGFLTERLPSLETQMLETTVWTPHLIQETIEVIGPRLRKGLSLNLCIFIDALDEHDGDHQGLLRLVVSLRSLARNPSIRLRICLASRPENFFKQQLSGCPTLVIHHHTVNDIHTYTEGRICTAAALVRLSTSGITTLQQLSAKVIASAQGVFLWVRLVVDEIVEGLQEGDGLEELTEFLETAPSELTDLYKRTLQRTRRTSPRVLANTREEAYYMFRILAASEQPFTIYSLFSASLFLAKRTPLSIDFRSMSIDQLHQRLYNRSAGLLWATDTAHLQPRRAVQFIHQTTKDYMTNGDGCNVINEWVPEDRRESGLRLIFRYLLHLIVSYGRPGSSLESLDLYLVYRDFVHVASKLEAEEKRSIMPEAEQAVLGLPEGVQARFIKSLWKGRLSRNLMPADISSWEAVRKGTLMGNLPQSRSFMLLFSIYFGLRLSIIQYLAPEVSSITENDSAKLLQMATWNSTRPDMSVTGLLQAGLWKNISEPAWDARDLGVSIPHVLSEQGYYETIRDLRKRSGESHRSPPQLRTANENGNY